MAAFAFGRGKMFDGEILALSAFSALTWVAKYSWDYLKMCGFLLDRHGRFASKRTFSV
jgi:hypothetical protein